jgi:multiple sugar transport system ATP-binding protein
MTLADRIVILNDCKIEQVGTPMEVYARPASRFVAGYIGSPAMNIMAVTLTGSGDRAAARLGNGAVVPLPFAPVGEGPWDLGIRPEALTVAAEGTTTALATVVERLGDRTLVYARMSDGTQVIAQDGGKSAVKAGDSIGLAFDTTEMYLFGADGRVVQR